MLWSWHVVYIFTSGLSPVVAGGTARRHRRAASGKSADRAESYVFSGRRAAGAVPADQAGFCGLLLRQRAVVYAPGEAADRLRSTRSNPSDVDQASGAADRQRPSGGDLPGRAYHRYRLADEDLQRRRFCRCPIAGQRGADAHRGRGVHPLRPPGRHLQAPPFSPYHADAAARHAHSDAGSEARARPPSAGGRTPPPYYDGGAHGGAPARNAV